MNARNRNFDGFMTASLFQGFRLHRAHKVSLGVVEVNARADGGDGIRLGRVADVISRQ